MNPPDWTLNSQDADQMVVLEHRLGALSDYASELLVQLEAGRVLSQEDLDQAEELYKQWLETFVFEHRFYNFIEPITLGEKYVMSSYGMQIFIELSRLHFIMHAESWQREQQLLSSLGYTPGNAEDYDILWSLAMTKSRHWLEDNWPCWTKPVARYTQSEIRFAITYLCERIVDFPSADAVAMQDFSRFLFLLTTHNSRLFCFQNTADFMDMPEMRMADDTDPTLFNFNRSYAMYCTAYFGNALKRFHYHNLFWERRPADPGFDAKQGAERVKDWFATVVCPSLSEESFVECYTKVLDEAYECPGDDDWYMYREPQGAYSRGAVLSILRPTLSKRYYSEERATVGTVVDAALRYKYGNVSREFVVEAIDMYLTLHFNIKWRSGLVISHAELETSQVKLLRAPAPLIVQAFSRYWLYDKFSQPPDTIHVWPTDSIYETIAAWMHQCLTRYNGRLFGANLTPLLTRVLGGINGGAEKPKSAAEKVLHVD